MFGPPGDLFVAFECGTEDIAQGSAGVRRAILFDGFFFFRDFAGLDRYSETARLVVHVGDADYDGTPDLFLSNMGADRLLLSALQARRIATISA